MRTRQHRTVDRRADGPGQIAAEPREWGQARPDTACRRGGARGAHGVDPRERLVEDERQRVQVGRPVRGVALRLLRRHVRERPDDVTGARQGLVARDGRDAEVRELRDPRLARRLLRDHDVRRLDVTVHDAARVRVLQRVAERSPDPQDIAVRQRPHVRQVGERAPANHLRDQVHRGRVAARLVERHDPRVLQPRGGERLPLGARGHVLVVQFDALHRDDAIQSLVVRRARRRRTPPRRGGAPAGTGRAPAASRPRRAGRSSPACRRRSAPPPAFAAREGASCRLKQEIRH